MTDRWVPFAAAILVFGLFEYIYRNPVPIVWVGIIVGVIPAGAVYLIFRGRKNDFFQWIRLTIPIMFLCWSGLGFSLLLTSKIWMHVLALVVALFLILYIEGILSMLWAKGADKDAQSYPLENLSVYALTLAIFLGSTVMFGFHTLLNWNLGLLTAIFLIFLWLTQYEFFWMSRLPTATVKIHTAVTVFIFLEFFLVLTRLPLHFMVAGGVITVLWYMVTAIERAHLLKLLSQKMLARHLTLGGVLLAVLLSTARWI